MHFHEKSINRASILGRLRSLNGANQVNGLRPFVPRFSSVTASKFFAEMSMYSLPLCSRSLLLCLDLLFMGFALLV